MVVVDVGEEVMVVVDVGEAVMVDAKSTKRLQCNFQHEY